MKPDYYSLVKAGLNQEEIAKISGCEDQGIQIRMLRKYWCNLLEEIHVLNEYDLTGKTVYAQTDKPNLSVDVIPIGRVASDLSVFDELDSREEITFSLAE